MRKHKNKDIDKYLRDLAKQGWVMRDGGPGHFKIESPGGSLVSFSNSPSCPYALNHIKKDVARALIKDAERGQE